MQRLADQNSEKHPKEQANDSTKERGLGRYRRSNEVNMPIQQENLLKEANEVIKQAKQTIFNLRVIVAAERSENDRKDVEISLLKSELEYQKKLAAVIDECVQEDRISQLLPQDQKIHETLMKALEGIQ